VPGGLSEAVDETLIVSVEVAEDGVTEVGLSVQVIPVGPEHVRATLLLNPFEGFRVMIEVADDPLATGLGEGAVAVRVKLAVAPEGTILAKKASDVPPP